MSFRSLSVVSVLVGSSLLLGCSGEGERESAKALKGAPPAAPGLIDANAVQVLSDTAWRHGEASTGRDVHGDPLIRADWDGRPYEIWFYGCEDGRACRDIRFVARRDTALDWHGIADWNGSHRFGKLHRRPDGRLEMQMNVTLAGGVSAENLAAQFETWGLVLAQLAEL
ncbi:MAG: YbjN domain-containing protein [Pseudomonadota bacterium]